MTQPNPEIKLNNLRLKDETREFLVNAPNSILETILECGYQTYINCSAPIINNYEEITAGHEIANNSIIHLNKPISIGFSNTATSSLLGAYAEEYVFDILSEVYFVKKVSKISKSGDLLVETNSKLSGNNITILIEVKNYTRPVPSEEVNKYLRDLSVKRTNGGVFISINSQITGKDNFEITYESIEGRIVPSVYICGTEAIVQAVQIVNQMIKSREYLYEVLAKDKIHKNAIKSIQTIDLITRARSDLSDIMQIIQRKLSTNHNNLFAAENKIREYLKIIENECVPEQTINNDEIFHIANLYNCDEYATKIIRELQKISKTNITEHSFKKYKSRIYHVDSKFGINLLKDKSEFIIPAILANVKLKQQLISIFESQIRIDSKEIIITINKDTINWIINYLNNVNITYNDITYNDIEKYLQQLLESVGIMTNEKIDELLVKIYKE